MFNYDKFLCVSAARNVQIILLGLEIINKKEHFIKIINMDILIAVKAYKSEVVNQMEGDLK